MILSHMDIVLCPLKHTVFIDIPCFHTVSSRRAGVKQVDDLTFAPRPEHLRVQALINTEIDVYFRISAGVKNGGAVLPSLRVFPNGVIQCIKHSSGFVEISCEEILSAVNRKMTGIRFR